MIKVNALSKYYDVGSIRTQVFKSLSFCVNEGEFVSIVGPSGAGKTTLLNTIGLLERFQSGSLALAGHDVSKLSDTKLSAMRNRYLGFIFQDFNLLPELDVLSNVMLPLEIAGVKTQDAKDRALYQLQRMGLQGRVHHKPYLLSGGQQQRVAIARALVCEPKMILADEPTGNLNSQMAFEIMQLLQEINRQGTTILMVTHDENLSNLASRKISLSDGKIVEVQPQELASCG
ncbi:macrolide ABC transporter ATP-binding protein [Pseudoalteromonas amylolytica]|uniref:Macrolide ABC transporter ATP-binding protein n=1 Tax=Pseudoalteromonas amylolytica TaxID=1859457 RepID=A0A1S1MVQ3_9GAMM|nr:macrolide ABC transporter ATP-binding protein [Pseudoalteromonas sp. JW3]OHU92860.1 macrolide ABC transporter ATP-binding protein [Pseudoalteromonas amylolytica]